MKRFLQTSVLLLAAALLAAGCAASRRTHTATTAQTDSTHTATARADSTHTAAARADSTYVKDSIFVHEKNDTLYKYRERTFYRLQTRTDTVYREILRADTVFLASRNTATTERQIPAERKTPLWKTATALAAAGLIALLALFIIRHGGRKDN